MNTLLTSEKQKNKQNFNILMFAANCNPDTDFIWIAELSTFWPELAEEYRKLNIKIRSK